MRDRLVGLVERAELAIASCAEVVDQQHLAPLIGAVAAVRTRLSYSDEVVVVALAGGTGSGKSSLFNAVIGAEIMEVGGVRPTTSVPAAAVPASAGTSVDGYLDHLGIEERYVYEGRDVCVIDLPDTDSVESENRYRADAVLGLVDVIVWVVDPEKYRDARLHADYLAPMSDYSSQFVFVLNQIDRLSKAQAREVIADFRGALSDDGISDPRIVPLSAAPPVGPPVGIEGLEKTLQVIGTDRQILYGKLLNDLAATAGALEQETGGPVGFDSRAAEAVASAATALGAGDARSGTAVMIELMDAVSAATTGPIKAKLESLTADVPAHMQRIAAETPDPAGPRRWFWQKESAPSPDVTGDNGARISAAIVRPARALLAKRAVAIASIAELAVAAEAMRNAVPR